MSAIENEAELTLGRVILKCRHRRRSTVWLDLGGSWIHLLLVYPKLLDDQIANAFTN